MPTDPPLGRRERNKRDKRARILSAARELFAERGVGAVTTQQIADRADIAAGTLFLYASTKAELLIMVQNEKFAEAIDEGLGAAKADPSAVGSIVALVRPVVSCIRGQLENGQAYLRELVFGDPTEPHRREGLALSARLEAGIAGLIRTRSAAEAGTAILLARVVSAVIHAGSTAAVYKDRTDAEVLADIGDQIVAILQPATAAHRVSPSPA